MVSIPVKIMLFTADSSLAHAVIQCLKEAGYKVVSRSQGSGALELIREERPGLVILDIDLPGFSSTAIIRRLRADSPTVGLPVILMGAAMHEEDCLMGLEVGADVCLMETFHPRVFVARVKSLLRRSEAVQSHWSV